MTSATVSGKNEMKRRVSYMLADLKAKSIRQRCIRVAEIIIVITLGDTNICGAGRKRN
jgi:lipoate-protein ligase B